MTDVIRPGLARIRMATRLSSHPERAFRAVHIAGTNGKGSTACFIDAILRSLYPKGVGLYTSPHLVSIEERIRVDGEMIPPTELENELGAAAVLSAAVEKKTGAGLSLFEALTWVAFDWYRKSGVTVAVLETGLGGRWDATTVCRPDVCAITTVGRDHQEWLGRTLADIAAEKAGIMKPGVPAVIGRLKPSARKAVRRAAREKKAPLFELDRDFTWEGTGEDRLRIRTRWADSGWIRLGMEGGFQRDNAAVAFATAGILASRRGFNVDEFVDAARSGLERARWPGRLSLLSIKGKRPTWVDGAHNPEAAEALSREIASWKRSGSPKRVIAIWSMVRGKDAEKFQKALSGSIDGWVVYQMDQERGAPIGFLSGVCRKTGVPHRIAADFYGAWREAQSWAGKGGAAMVCGSLMAVGDAYRSLVGGIS